MKLRTATLLALANPSLAAVVARDVQHILSSSITGSSPSVGEHVSFACDLPPSVAPDSDGLASANELFSGPAALDLQVQRHSALVRIPSVSYDDMGDVDKDERWNVFLDLHRLLENLYPKV